MRDMRAVQPAEGKGAQLRQPARYVPMPE